MPAKKPDVVICASPEEVALKAAQAFVRLANRAPSKGGTFTVALSGGRTPLALYRLLSGEEYREKTDWGRVHFFWGDERCVPPTHDDSNYRAASAALLGRLNIPAANIHRIRGENGAGAAGEYEAELRGFFGLTQEGRGLPEFDLILLGMGPDGHAASIFPDTPALREDRRAVTSVYVEKLRSTRITLTLPVIRNARNVFFLVTGVDKAEALGECLEGPLKPDEPPAGLISRLAKGRVRWFVDRAAAEKLSSF